MDWWQHIPQHMNPVLFSIGSYQMRYYGLMYILAFITVYALISYRLKHENFSFNIETIQSFMVWAIVGVMAGGRLGYVLFYDLQYFIHNPLQIVMPVNLATGKFTGISGMSYHGGVIGVVVSVFFFCKRYHISFDELSRLVVPVVPLGYTFGRLGNFINGELYGRVTSVPWGMYFPMDMTHQLRHPSQLYEAFFEGIVLFLVLWFLRKNAYFKNYLLGIYLIGYGTVRFFIEFVREPDAQLGFIIGFLTMGQILCVVMVVAGAGLILLKRYVTKHE